MSRYISRNPFARETLTRENVPANPSGGCAWCSSLRFRNPLRAETAYLYRYTVTPDTGRPWVISGAFCSIGCARAYHDGRF